MDIAIKGIARVTLSLLLWYSCTHSSIAVGEKPNSLIAQSQPSKYTLVIPGERVGLVTRHTTRRDLVKLFGESINFK